MKKINIVDLGYDWVTFYHNNKVPKEYLAHVLEFATWAQQKYNENLFNSLSFQEQELFNDHE